jgi:hypothetical protein
MPLLYYQEDAPAVVRELIEQVAETGIAALGVLVGKSSVLDVFLSAGRTCITWHIWRDGGRLVRGGHVHLSRRHPLRQKFERKTYPHG